jgi:uncharacterized protein HemX
MRFVTWLGLGVLLLAAAFFGLNAALFATPVKLNLLITSVETPMGLVPLILLVLVLGAVGIYIGAWQGTFAREFRRQSRELESQRTLAERAEGSRFTELGKLLQSELARSNERIEAAIAGLRQELRESENSLAATLAEFDDRVTRTLERSGSGHSAVR